MGYKPIRSYGVIGNTRTAALVGLDGSIDWCCFPRFDSPSVFAAILDDRKGGKFKLEPADNYGSIQAYLGHTNVLVTQFRTRTGSAELIDFMPCWTGANGRLRVHSEIHRILRCHEGEIAFDVFSQPGFDYARSDCHWSTFPQVVVAEGNGEVLTLTSRMALAPEGGVAQARFVLQKGQEEAFLLSYGRGRRGLHQGRGSQAKLEKTRDYWAALAGKCAYEGPWREAIIRSYLVLKLLTYSPTGAIVAAPTTSLPEELGGVRNWDYRYAWLRDSAFVLDALLSLGDTEEATGFMRWIRSICPHCRVRGQILFGIDFMSKILEVELPHLEGYRGSRPVRIGNDAYHQAQLDVYGEILNSAYVCYVLNSFRRSVPTWRMLREFVEAAAERWQDRDQGIWEVRSGPQHFVHSKFMCWVALDRGIKIAQAFGHAAPLARWKRVAEEIRRDVLTRGWSESKGAFVQHYDGQNLDASILRMPLVDFLPAGDPRMRSTVERIRAELGYDGLVHRYRTEETEDGLPGSEGAFTLCTFWLIRNLTRMGQVDEARDLYERVLGYANHLGLFSEMVNPATGELLGNFPQAFTHVGVINAGLELAQAMAQQQLGRVVTV